MLELALTPCLRAACTRAAVLFLASGVAAALPQGATERVSVRSVGLQGSQRSLLPAVSADGRYVAFESFSPELVQGDTNGTWDVFRRDRLTGEVLRVSVGPGGQEANGPSLVPSISADGSLVAFVSYAANLVPGDSNNQSDAFVHDCATGQTTRVSVDSAGQQCTGVCSRPVISGDGRHVAFLSLAADLVPGDTNGKWDVFVRDLSDGPTRRVSVDSGGAQADGHSLDPALSQDGRFVVFPSEATNLVAGDTNGVEDVFVHDTATGVTSRVSVGSGGAQASGSSKAAAISADGRWVGFYSEASNLVTADTNGVGDVFVHDRQTGQTTRVSIASDGSQASGGSFGPSLSGDGRWVAFESDAPDLVAGDTNGLTDLFVHDRLSGQTTRASISSDGAQANGASQAACLARDASCVAFHSQATTLVLGDASTLEDVFVHELASGVTSMQSVCGRGIQADGEAWRTWISADGRFVAFDSPADDLVLGDTNGQSDVFVHHRPSGTTERVSLAFDGQEGNSWSASGRVTHDGRWVSFDSDASNLVPGDTNGAVDVFVHDRWSGHTERVDLGPGGAQSNGTFNFSWDISPDGRFVLFSTNATNLVPGDTNGREDVFVRDREAAVTERVSVGTGGVQANGDSEFCSLSADGRFVAFESGASNLVAGDSNNATDVFVRDRQTGTTERVSVSTGGGQGNAASRLPRISPDGRFVAFQSDASDLVPGDGNGVRDVFLHDRQTGATVRVSVDSLGGDGNGPSQRPALSADGRYVAFLSMADDLVLGDTNGLEDVFVRDLQSGSTRRVSVSSGGVQSDGACDWPSLSADGRFAAFTSAGTTLVPADTNGLRDAFVHDLDPGGPTTFCQGDGSEGPCPCGNSGSFGHGCENAQATGGVRLDATGSTAANDVVLRGTGYPPAAEPGVVVIRGSTLELSPVPFGDGLRCVGTSGLVRLGATNAVGGVSTHPLNHAAGAGTFHYQLWYRNNPASFCTPAAFNMSSGLSLVWP